MQENTRCILCKRDGPVKRVMYEEPRDEYDSTAMILRGDLCEDCVIVHWAWEEKIEQP